MCVAHLALTQKKSRLYHLLHSRHRCGERRVLLQEKCLRGHPLCSFGDKSGRGHDAVITVIAVAIWPNIWKFLPISSLVVVNFCPIPSKNVPCVPRPPAAS